MKLVLKLPDGKPPFIGIEFDNAWEGERCNKDLMLEFKDEVYTLLIEPTVKANLRLVSDGKRICRFYNQIEYDSGKLKLWIEKTRHAQVFNFGHTFQEKSKDKICKVIIDSKSTPFVLKLKRYTVYD